MKIFFGLLILLVVTFVACDKTSPGDSYDLSGSIPPYVTITDKDTQIVALGDTVALSFQMRTAMQQNVTVTYNVSGAFTLTDQTVVIERNTRSTDFTVAVPADLVVTPPAEADTAVVTLTKAVTDDGKALTVGQLGDPSLENVIIVASQP